MNLLICSAFPPEIQLILNSLVQKKCSKYNLWEGILGNNRILAATLGVGLISATSTLNILLENEDVSRIIFTGTCGLLSGTPEEIGDIVRADEVLLGDLGTLSKDTYCPDIMKKNVSANRFITGFPVGFREFDVFCPISITKSVRGVELLKAGFTNLVENLECYSVAWSASNREIPFECILGISNIIGPDGHLQWLENHKRVSDNLQKNILKWLENIK